METALIIMRLVYLLKDFRFSPDSPFFLPFSQNFLRNEFFGMTPNPIK